MTGPFFRDWDSDCRPAVPGPFTHDLSPQLSRIGARKPAAPDEPFRFPEAAAQPASSLRVRGVHALQVRRPCVRSALLGLERELPANLVGITLLAR